VYGNMGEYSKAISYYEKALEISQKTLSAIHPDLATSYNNIGLVYYNKGEYSEALSYLERAFDILQRSLSPNQASIKNVRAGIEIINKKL
jgi:tetratricopeptide (TPR) repeat protein